MVTENRKISFRYSGDTKLDITTGNLGGEFAPECRNGFIDSSIETVAKKPRWRFDEENEEEKKRDMRAKRTDIKRKLEQKMTVVIYRHKFAIRRVFFGLRAKKNKERRRLRQLEQKALFVISKREVSDTVLKETAIFSRK